MLDLSDTLDAGTNLPDTWKTLVRELLLKFEDGCTYKHTNIVGNRPYTVDLKISIEDPVDDEAYEKLHAESIMDDEINEAIGELMQTITEYIDSFDDEDNPLELIRELKHEIYLKTI